jgi:hypothetical protein
LLPYESGVLLLFVFLLLLLGWLLLLTAVPKVLRGTPHVGLKPIRSGFGNVVTCLCVQRDFTSTGGQSSDSDTGRSPLRLPLSVVTKFA